MNTKSTGKIRDPYEDLMNAIAVRAANDYKHYFQVLQINPNNQRANVELERIKNYFTNGLFGMMYKVEPEFIFKELEKQVLNRHKTRIKHASKTT